MPKGRTRRRRQETIPDPVKQEVLELARRLEGSHAEIFAANSRLKRCVGRLLVAGLPPRRPPGRPGLPAVSKAQKMLEDLRRMQPGERPRTLWRQIYPSVIEGYDLMNRAEQRAAAQELRDRVRWRRQARRRAGIRRIKT